MVSILRRAIVRSLNRRLILAEGILFMDNYAWAGKILRVDLSSGQIIIEDSNQYVYLYLGGRGLGQSIIYQEISDNVKAFSEENLLVFSAGVLTGTAVPCACRLSIDSKNPVTGGVASSNVGGYFAAELKYAGFDAIVVKGISLSPVYLYIRDDRISIESAKQLWGRGTRETEEILRSYLQDQRVKILSIGPTGENLTKSACIIVDGARAAGRCALGAVMGSKNMKAVVVRGSKRIKIHSAKMFYKEVSRCLELLNKNEMLRHFKRAGTPSTIPHANKMCRLLVRNFQDDCWDEDKLSRVLSDEFQQYKVKNMRCFNCPIKCSAFYYIKIGEFKGVACEGFQANLIWDYMAKMDMDDPAAALKIQELCTDYGLDIDNSSGVISWATELFENDLLTVRDTEGLILEWGNYRTIIKLLDQIAHREGLGEILALGIKEASEHFGKETAYYAIHIKGQELAEGIRSLKGWGLGTVVAPRGGGHLDGAITTEISQISPEESQSWFGFPGAGEPNTYSGKAKAVFWMERFKAVVDMMGICCFATKWLNNNLIGLEEINRLLATATGIEIGIDELMLTG